jgi:hypothetical protein
MEEVAGKRYCEICGIHITIINFSRHTRSKRHSKIPIQDRTDNPGRKVKCEGCDTFCHKKSIYQHRKTCKKFQEKTTQLEL